MFRSLLWQSLTEVWGTPSISDTGEERISILPEKDHTGFFYYLPQKVLSVRLHSKSQQKSSKCQNLLTSWHLEFLGGYQLKKHPVQVHLR